MLLYISQAVLAQVAGVPAVVPPGILELLALGGSTGGGGIFTYIIYDYVKTRRNGKTPKTDPTADALAKVAKHIQKSSEIQSHILDKLAAFDTRQQLMGRDIAELVEHARR